MKRMLIVLGAVLLLALVVVPTAKTANAANVFCYATPSSAPVSSTVRILCSGFDPNTWVYAYYTEPDGAAVAFGGFKTDVGGNVAISFFCDQRPFFTCASGTWSMTVQELSGGVPVLTGIAQWTVTGGTEGVSGAFLTHSGPVNWDGVAKGVAHFMGSGFASGEIVTVWIDFPNSDCSSGTLHFDTALNIQVFNGIGTFLWGNVTANPPGNIAFDVFFPVAFCEGEYHIVARGNASGRGAEDWLTVTGNAVTETALLTVRPTSTSAMFGFLSFTAYGYRPFEYLTCWLTSPQGQVFPYFPFGTQTMTDAAGVWGFNIFTGSAFPGFGIASEGALGEWAMTCRGNRSGRNGIARFTIVGNMVDP
jgi:hypothetical protein